MDVDRTPAHRAAEVTATPGRPRKSDDDGRSFTQLPGRQVTLSMICLALVMFLGALSQTIVATALPRIVADLGGFDRYAWVATSYLVAATVAAPIAGGLSDIYGRKPFFVLGLAIFIVASFLLGISGSMNEIIVFRGVQGIGTGRRRGRCVHSARRRRDAVVRNRVVLPRRVPIEIRCTIPTNR